LFERSFFRRWYVPNSKHTVVYESGRVAEGGRMTEILTPSETIAAIASHILAHTDWSGRDLDDLADITFSPTINLGSVPAHVR
jgi:hypothetical protein